MHHFDLSRALQLPVPAPPTRHPNLPTLDSSTPYRPVCGLCIAAVSTGTNDMQKVIDKRCTSVLFPRVFVYTEPRSANQNPRPWSAFPSRHHSSVRSELPSSQNLQLSNLPTFKHAFDRPRDEKSHTATPLVPADCKCPLPQPLYLHILTNAPGVWGSTLPFLKFYLNSFCSTHFSVQKAVLQILCFLLAAHYSNFRIL